MKYSKQSSNKKLLREKISLSMHLYIHIHTNVHIKVNMSLPLTYRYKPVKFRASVKLAVNFC